MLSLSLKVLTLAKRSSKGIYDKELWCEKCERWSCKLDYYMAQTLLDENNIIPISTAAVDQEGPFFYKCVKGDPIRLQMFALSILWRASASKRPEVKQFSLGPYQDRVRDILRSGDQNMLLRYPLILQREIDETAKACILTPARNTRTGLITFRGGGFSFHVKMTNRTLSRCLEPLVLRPGSPVILQAFSLLKTPQGQHLIRYIQAIERNFGPQYRYKK